MNKSLNQLVTGDNFINEDENDYIYASLSKPPLKIISKNGSDDSLDFTVACPTCKSHRNYGTELFMLSGDYYCNTIGCREKCISNNKVKY